MEPWPKRHWREEAAERAVTTKTEEDAIEFIFDMFDLIRQIMTPVLPIATLFLIFFNLFYF